MTGVFTITPVFPAPAPIIDPVIIDGYTQGSRTGTTIDDAKPNTLAVGNNAVLRVRSPRRFARYFNRNRPK